MVDRGTDGTPADEGTLASYFDDLQDGCGCAEIWEYVSERRRAEE